MSDNEITPLAKELHVAFNEQWSEACLTSDPEKYFKASQIARQLLCELEDSGVFPKNFNEIAKRVYNEHGEDWYG